MPSPQPSPASGRGSKSIAEALQWASQSGLQRLDAQLLLLHVLGRDQQDRAWLIAHDTDAMEEPFRCAYESLCTRRRNGEPLAYLVGEKEFFGLPLKVDARVLVPRPDTETLVDWALEAIASTPSPAIVDLGTGSGAIALALKHRRPDARVHAVDRSEAALEVARANAARLELDVAFRQASWLEGASNGFQLVVTNPPYVAAADPHLAALTHEPLCALASGPEGLDDIRTIVSQAPAHLAAGGWLMLEHGWDQAAAVRELLARAGLRHVQSRRDLAGIERCSGGQWFG